MIIVIKYYMNVEWQLSTQITKIASLLILMENTFMIRESTIYFTRRKLDLLLLMNLMTRLSLNLP